MKLTIILVLALHASSASDTLTTRAALARGASHEGNPIISHFASNKSPLALASVQQAGITPLTAMLLRHPHSRKLKIVAATVLAAQIAISLHNSHVK